VFSQPVSIWVLQANDFKEALPLIVVGSNSFDQLPPPPLKTADTTISLTFHCIWMTGCDETLLVE